MRAERRAVAARAGYPARLFLPGWEGNASVKWLRRLELSDRPFMTREETSKYRTVCQRHGTDVQLCHGCAIAHHLSGVSVTLTAGWVEINGIAWTGSGRIRRVDVSTDGGKTWTGEATLQDPVLPKAHTLQTSMAMDRRRGRDHEPRCRRNRLRAADAQELLKLRGPGTTGYHLNPITGWVVQADGRVVYKEEAWG